MFKKVKSFIQKVAIKFQPFSLKQKKVFTWWMEDSPYSDCNGIICDGAIRAGKTVCMALSFIFWAMDTFDGQNFGMCGKTVGSFQRNVWMWLKPVLYFRGYRVTEIKTPIHVITISRKGKDNYFYIFGGKDEGSQNLIQGITLAGLLLDEVALMPESFVNQATGRCSVEGSKWFFNCNPDAPMHFFNQNWILKAREKNIYHLHFTMDDNPSLSERLKNRYKSMYVGVFFQRFILGLWVMAQGAIYKDAWSPANEFTDDDVPEGFWHRANNRRYVGIDYGTVHAMVFLDCYDDGVTLWIRREYFYEGKKSGIEKDNKQYGDDFMEFVSDNEYKKVDFVIIDPSANSFKIELRNRRIRTKITDDMINADNEVVEGIRAVSTMLHSRRLRIHKHNCKNTINQLLSYVWDDKAIQKGAKEKPIKVNDDGPDVIRYLVQTMVSKLRLVR